MDEIAVTQLHAGDGDGAGMVFTFNDRQISVSIFPSNGRSTQQSRRLEPEDRPLQDRLIDLVARAVTCEDDDEYDELEGHVLGIILEAGKPFFSRPGTSQEPPTLGHASLHHLLFPEILYFRLEATAGHTSVIPIEPSEAYTALAIDPALDGDIEHELEFDERLPRYIPEDIILTELFLRGASYVTAAVQVDGQDMFCKARGRPSSLFGTSLG